LAHFDVSSARPLIDGGLDWDTSNWASLVAGTGLASRPRGVSLPARGLRSEAPRDGGRAGPSVPAPRDGGRAGPSLVEGPREGGRDGGREMGRVMRLARELAMLCVSSSEGMTDMLAISPARGGETCFLSRCVRALSGIVTPPES
jgi:hypothetical protein